MMASSNIDKHFFLIEYIRKNGGASRLTIANHFDMNAATVGNAIERLIEEGIVYEDNESGKVINGSGRPQIMIRINPNGAYFIGLNFSGDILIGVMTDFEGKQLSVIERALPSSKEEVLKVIYKVIKELLDIADDRGVKISGIGIGVPGISDALNGISLTYNRIKNWNNVPLTEIIGSMFNLPVFIDHNSNCFALGEITTGDVKGFDNILSVTIRTGVAMGIIKNKEILNLSHISSGELGHMVINPKGKKCWCGSKGCLETYVSGWLWKKKMKQKKNTVNCYDFDLNDDFTVKTLSEMFDYLGIAIENVNRIFQPEAIVINGIFNCASDLMKEKIQKRLVGFGSHNSTCTNLIISSKSDAIGAVGAALMAMARIYKPYSNSKGNF
jgi:N-acetylglucosamine repressor